MRGVTPVPLGVPEVLPALNSNRVNAAHTPALTCGQLQWISRFDHVVADSHAYMIGALVVSESATTGLPDEQKKILEETGAVAARALTAPSMSSPQLLILIRISPIQSRRSLTAW